MQCGFARSVSFATAFPVRHAPFCAPVFLSLFWKLFILLSCSTTWCFLLPQCLGAFWAAADILAEFLFLVWQFVVLSPCTALAGRIGRYIIVLRSASESSFRKSAGETHFAARVSGSGRHIIVLQSAPESLGTTFFSRTTLDLRSLPTRRRHLELRLRLPAHGGPC